MNISKDELREIIKIILDEIESRTLTAADSPMSQVTKPWPMTDTVVYGIGNGNT